MAASETIWAVATGRCYCHLVGRGLDTAKHPTMHRIAPTPSSPHSPICNNYVSIATCKTSDIMDARLHLNVKPALIVELMSIMKIL